MRDFQVIIHYSFTRMFRPKILDTLKGYGRRQLSNDLLAGLIVGLAIVAGFIISALGGSRVQIGGPTGAFIVIVYGIVQTRRQ
jgi:SulP family sulfate permease